MARAIGFLGGGKMAQAMAKGFIAADLVKPDGLIASCHPSDTLSLEAFQALGGKAITENTPVVKQSEVVFISVKPNVVPTVLNDIKPVASGKLFISIAMGISISVLEKSLPNDAKVIRVMPNTPALVRQACSVFVRGKAANENDIETTVNLLNSIGIAEEVPEYYIDAVTGLSGSGPAYIYILIEGMADGAVKMGLPRDLAYRLASQTVLGGAQMVKETGDHPGKLKDDVTSPGGTTAAGLWYLEKMAFRSAIAGAVEAATNKALQTSLGKK